MTAALRRLAHALRRSLRRLSPVQAIALGYAMYVAVLALLLALPFLHAREGTSLLDHLFTAASAVSTTGLATIVPADVYDFGGELVLLIGIQAGGLGYMTFGSFAILASRGRVSRSRIQIGRSVFSMPDHFEPVSFLRRAVIFTFVVEAVGAIGLAFAFAEAGVPSPLWPAVFHSVSSFCTAGFSTFPDSLESFRGNAAVNGIVSALSILGAVGFIVASDAWISLRRRRDRPPITLTSRIILTATAGGIAAGTIALFFDPSIAALPLRERALTAFFQSMTALTTVGFDTHAIGQLSSASVVVLIVLMLLGASPSGTGGGLKSTTWSAALAAMWSAVRGRREVTFFGYVVPPYRIQAAFASFTLYLCVFSIGCFSLLIADRHSFEAVVFEVASALGTVGLSRGITADLASSGKVVVILLMFVGRVGVISLGLAALSKRDGETPVAKEADLVV